MNIKTELLNENILKITSKRTLPFSVITNISFIIIFFTALYAFHSFIESYQEVSIGIIKDKKLCNIEQDFFIYGKKNTQAEYIEMKQAKLYTHSSRGITSYCVELPCEIDHSKFILYKNYTLNRKLTQWITNKFNELNNDTSLNSFKIDIQRGDFYKSSYFLFDISSAIILFIFSFLIFGSIPYRSELLIDKEKNIIQINNSTFLFKNFPNFHKIEFEISKIKNIDKKDIGKLFQPIIFTIENGKIYSFNILQLSQKGMEEPLSIIKNFLNI